MLDLAVLFTSGYKKENVYFIPHSSEGLYVTYVLYQDGQGKAMKTQRR